MTLADSERTSSFSDLSERPASTRTRDTAFLFVIAMCIASFASTAFGERSAPMSTFIPVAAALWAAAELLTAYLLLSQFLVNGVRLLLTLGAGYTFTGLLAIPYVLNWPGALGVPGNADARQISFVLWVIWHFVFPAIVAAGIALDRGIDGRVLDRARMRFDCFALLTAVAIGCVLVSVFVIGLARALPVFIVDGRFTPLFRLYVAPICILANLAVALLVVRRTPVTALHVWLAVALTTSAIDVALNAFAGTRYSPSWYVGKVLTLTTASVVLVALLAEVAALYRRAGVLAMNDSLTGLRNRRTFDDCAAWAFTLLRRQRGEVALLMIDVDFFKRYNDLYGHPAGDACLCRVGEALQQTVRRGGDVVARYGGEEFAALLPDASLQNATELAERLRRAVQMLAIPHRGGVADLGVVTISVGVAYTHDFLAGDPAALLDVADRALYAAKERRNAVVVETRGLRETRASA
ncbi:MAG: GGDEF domain-containing protein [Vulcanimicrobiaceae bacterium]